MGHVAFHPIYDEFAPKKNVPSPPPQINKQISLLLSDSFGLQLDLFIAQIKVRPNEKYVTAIVLKHKHKVL